MKNKLNNELAVCGFAAVKALEKKHPQLITRFYFSADKAPLFGGLCKKLASQKIPYNQVADPKELEKLCGSIHHQGAVAMIPQPEIEPLTQTITTEWLHNKEDAILLDRVGNANNLGAIVRSAAFFGIHNIVIPLDEAQSSITTSSYRVAQGGMEYVNIYSIRSISNLLADMKDKMIRFGTDVNANCPVSDIRKLSNKKGALIVLGNEEQGISLDVKHNCDYLVTIPGSISDGTLDSLNVVQAAAVIFYECSKNRGDE